MHSPCFRVRTRLLIVSLFSGSESVPGSAHGKDSVFKKLHARLRYLELNISLSSEYLSQLSRQYVTQMDEMRMRGERTARAANETTVVLQRLVNTTQEQVSGKLNESKVVTVLDINYPPQLLPSVDEGFSYEVL